MQTIPNLDFGSPSSSSSFFLSWIMFSYLSSPLPSPLPPLSIRSFDHSFLIEFSA